MSTRYQPPRRPADFDAVFVQQGWRGIERIFGARTPINKRWVDQGGERLKELRLRYRKGDAGALEEAREALSHDDAKATIATRSREGERPQCSRPRLNDLARRIDRSPLMLVGAFA